jgi:hypothetical protein
MSGQSGGPGELFEQFLAWKQAQDAQSADDDIEVPLFEQGENGTQRSATLPWRHARPLLERWGWIPPEGAGDGDSDQGEKDSATGGPAGFFRQIAGGNASGPAPAPGTKARKAAS